MSLLEAVDQPPFSPPGPAYEGMTIPQRMCEVIRRKAREGQPTTLTDFREAEETCDLTVGQLTDNIGIAKRMMNKEVVRYDHPPVPINPWDIDEKYRQERVERAARLIAGAPGMGDADIFAVLRNEGYGTCELGALWKEILIAAANLVRKFAVA